jgi:hypothetical protein
VRWSPTRARRSCRRAFRHLVSEVAAPHHTRLSYRRHIYEAALLTALQAKLGASCYLYPCSLLYLGCSSPSLPDSDTSGLHALQ